VDILQKVIQWFSKEGRLNHRLGTNLTCLVIQYPDDTLVIFQGDPQQARLLKVFLEAFSMMTGLTINYDKSTLVAINLDNEDQTQIANILGCPIASFPQTYLGIPLFDTKLPRWALSSLLHSLDKRVDTLAISRATSGGLDKRRRAYFWLGQKSTSGTHCKVAWDAVCRPIEEGGLNIKNIEIQNICLLLKFIHKLHTPNKSSWANWIHSCVYSGQKRLGGKITRCSSS
jgi:hypothetical protein